MYYARSVAVHGLSFYRHYVRASGKLMRTIKIDLEIELAWAWGPLQGLAKSLLALGPWVAKF